MNRRGKKSETHHVPLDMDKDRPSRHAYLCMYLPNKEDKSKTQLIVFDPIVKKHANKFNAYGVWSISILKQLYRRLKRPTVCLRYGTSRGFDCVWQVLRKMGQILADEEAYFKNL